MREPAEPDRTDTTVLAIDIGGTKLAVAVVDPDGKVLIEDRGPTAGDDADSLFAALADLVDGVLAGTPVEPAVIGVGCGGPMTPDGDAVSPLNIASWRDFPLRSRLRERYELPTFVDNDAKALALGEGWQGAARERRNYLALVVSTGVGGGIVCDGRLLDGRLGNAGHLGHVIVEPQGRPCACGARGCLEAEASGTAIRAITGADPAEAPDEVRIRTGRLVGRAVANAATLLDLPLAVAAGSVALGYGAPFFDAANAEIERCCGLEFARGTRLVPAGCGRLGPVVGAAAVGRRGVGAPVLAAGSEVSA